MASDIDQPQTTHTPLEEKRKQVEEKKLESDKTRKLKKLLSQNPYVLDENGVGIIKKRKNPETEEYEEYTDYFIKNQVKISATCDDLDEGEKLFLVSIDDPIQGTIEIWKNQEELLTRSGLKSLIGDGVICVEDAHSEVSEYLQYEILRAYIEEPRKVSVNKVGWKRNNTIFASGNIAYEKDRSYEIINTYDKNKETYTKFGTLEEWKEGVSEIMNYKMAKISCYTSVASQINGILKQPSIILLNYGTTSRGKTLSASVAVSMDGDPSKIIMSAKATETAAERVASLTEGFCNVFDEAGDNKYFNDLIYMLSNGRGKQRGNIKGIDKTSTWNKSFIVTSESSLSKESDAQGKVGRIIECNWLLPNNPELAKKVEGVIKSNFGHLTELINKKIFEQIDNLQPRYEEICKTLPVVQVNAGNRIKDSFALLILAGEIVESVFKDIGIVNHDPYKLCEELYLENVGGERVDPYWQRGLNLTLEDIVSGRRERDSVGNPTNEFSVYGKIGIIFSDNYIDLKPSPLREICNKHELNYDQLIKEWKENGITECDKDKNQKTSKKYGKIIRINIEKMNEALSIEFDPILIISDSVEDQEDKNFEEPESNTEERKNNMLETMIGVAEEERKDSDIKSK